MKNIGSKTISEIISEILTISANANINKTDKFSNVVKIRPAKTFEYKLLRKIIAFCFRENEEDPQIPGFIEREPVCHEFFWGVFYPIPVESIEKSLIETLIEEYNLERGSILEFPLGGVMLVPFDIGIESISIHVAGLTGVGILPQFRHKGLGSLLLQEIHSYLISKGFDGSVLHSDADLLYKKNGYEFAFCDWNAELNYNQLIQYMKNKSLYSENVSNNIQIQKNETEPLIRRVDLKEGGLDNFIKEVFLKYSNSAQLMNHKVRINRSEWIFREFILRFLLKNPKTRFILGIYDYDLDNLIGYCAIRFNDDRFNRAIIDELILFDACFSAEETSSLNYILSKLFVKINEIRETLVNTLLSDVQMKIGKNNQTNSSSSDFSIVIQIHNEDVKTKKSLESMGFRIYRKYLTGQMANIFSIEQMLQKMIPVFSQRISAYNSVVSDIIGLDISEPLKIDSIKNLSYKKPMGIKFILNADNKRFLFETYLYSVHITRIDSQINQSTQIYNKGIDEIIVSREEIIGLIFGFIKFEDLDFSDEIVSSVSEEVLTIFKALFPPLEPIWEALFEY